VIDEWKKECAERCILSPPKITGRLNNRVVKSATRQNISSRTDKWNTAYDFFLHPVIRYTRIATPVRAIIMRGVCKILTPRYKKAKTSMLLIPIEQRKDSIMSLNTIVFLPKAKRQRPGRKQMLMRIPANFNGS
jgi:hypothetical protein